MGSFTPKTNLPGLLSICAMPMRSAVAPIIKARRVRVLLAGGRSCLAGGRPMPLSNRGLQMTYTTMPAIMPTAAAPNPQCHPTFSPR